MIKINNKIEFDKDLVKVVSYLTFDGHLAEDLKGFYLSSKDKDTLLYFKNLVKSKFQIKGRFLEKIGVPKGCKVKKIFLIPEWIKKNPKFCYHYLKTAFECEGGFWLQRKRYPIVRFGLNKNKDLMNNGKEFLFEMKTLLLNLNIETSDIWITKSNIRKDGIITKSFYFRIKQSSIERFLKMFNFSNRFKKESLITYFEKIRLPKRGTII